MSLRLADLEAKGPRSQHGRVDTLGWYGRPWFSSTSTSPTASAAKPPNASTYCSGPRPPEGSREAGPPNLGIALCSSTRSGTQWSAGSTGVAQEPDQQLAIGAGRPLRTRRPGGRSALGPADPRQERCRGSAAGRGTLKVGVLPPGHAPHASCATSSRRSRRRWYRCEPLLRSAREP